jgi:DNA-binding MarR family transcriptional regulator
MGVERAVALLRDLLRAVQFATAPEWLDLDLGKGQVRVLIALQTCGTSSMSGLAKQLNVQPPTASLVVDTLVQLGYVERTVNDADRRCVTLRMAHRGEKLLATLRHGRKKILDGWLAGLSQSEVELLCAGLLPLLRSIHETEAASPDATAPDVLGGHGTAAAPAS